MAKSIHSKLLFFVKNKGQWNAKSGPKVGDGKVVCEIFLRDVNLGVEMRAYGQKLVKFCTHTDTRGNLSSIDIYIYI